MNINDAIKFSHKKESETEIPKTISTENGFFVCLFVRNRNNNWPFFPPDLG